MPLSYSVFTDQNGTESEEVILLEDPLRVFEVASAIFSLYMSATAILIASASLFVL